MRTFVRQAVVGVGLVLVLSLLFGCGDNTKMYGGQCFSADGQAMSDFCRMYSGAKSSDTPDLTLTQAQIVLSNVMTGLLNGAQMSEVCLSNPSSPPASYSCDAYYGTAQGTSLGSTSGSVYVNGTNQYQSSTMEDSFIFSATFSSYLSSSTYVASGTLSNVVFTQPHSSDGSASSYTIGFSGELSIGGLDSANTSATKTILFENVIITYNSTYTVSGSVGGQTDLMP